MIPIKETTPFSKVGATESADLISEAKKYKTADEFVKAQNKTSYR
jgi:hypothetical protein